MSLIGSANPSRELCRVHELSALFVAVLGLAGAASSPVASAAKATRSIDSFCQLIAASSKNGNELNSTSPAIVKSAVDALRAIEPTTLLLAPPAIKRDLPKVFAIDNLMINEFARVHYETSKIPFAFGETIDKDAAAAKPDYNAFVSYANKTCRLNLRPEN